MDLIDELVETRGRFHDHPGNYATEISIDLLDSAIAELERLRGIERRTKEESDSTMSEDVAIALGYILRESG